MEKVALAARVHISEEVLQVQPFRSIQSIMIMIKNSIETGVEVNIRKANFSFSKIDIYYTNIV